MQARLHVISLPHSQTTREYGQCAFTEKVRKFCDMMTDSGKEVFLYAGDENEARVAKAFPCITRAEQKALGVPGPERVWDASFDVTQTQWTRFLGRADDLLRFNAEPGDYLCMMGGYAHKPLADNHPGLVPVEFGIGYPGSFAPFRVFESYAWMHASYAAQQGLGGADGRFYDAVIPSYFEPDAFPLGDGAGDYLLYLGRLTDRKGLAVVRDVAERTGLPLVMAGGGDESLVPPGADYRGVVGPAERAALLGGARCLLVPTLYVEPFGSVACEAMMTGTQAITTDWGAFTETVSPEFRCRTLAEFCDAVERAADVHRGVLRFNALQKWSTSVVAKQYGRYFDRLETLKHEGWYS